MCSVKRSAVPPTAYEWGGGWFGYEEQRDFLATSPMVPGLDEVMDCHLLTGDADYLLRVIVADLEAYERFIGAHAVAPRAAAMMPGVSSRTPSMTASMRVPPRAPRKSAPNTPSMRGRSTAIARRPDGN